MSKHKHLCGYTESHLHSLITSERGCGYIFTHEKSDKNHNCPKCGKYVNKIILTPELYQRYIEWKNIIKYNNPFNPKKY